MITTTTATSTSSTTRFLAKFLRRWKGGGTATTALLLSSTIQSSSAFLTTVGQSSSSRTGGVGGGSYSSPFCSYCSPSLFSNRVIQHIRGGGVRPSVGSSSTSRFGSTIMTTESSESDTVTGSASASTSISESKSSISDEELQQVSLTAKEKTTGEKLNELRTKMINLNLDAYVIPTDDPHLSEYVPDAYKRRAYISGFEGSAGIALVTVEMLEGKEKEYDGDAYLWTDSRYFNEATLSLDPHHWTLMKQGEEETPTLVEFLADLAKKKYLKKKTSIGDSDSKNDKVDGEKDNIFRLGLDPFVHPASFPQEVNGAFKKVSRDVAPSIDYSVSPHIIGEINTLDLEGNLVDAVWGSLRPPVPTSPFRLHPLKYAGRSVTEKVSEIRQRMDAKKASLSIFTALDDVAYLLNLRATGDVYTCPVGIAYATVTNESVSIYCDPSKIQSTEVQVHLEEAGVTFRLYDKLLLDVKNHISSNTNAKVWLDGTRSNFAICRLVPKGRLIDSQNAVSPMKAIKNTAEMEGMRRAHIVDGVAMANFVSWLENEIVQKGRLVSEVEIDKVLQNFRAEQHGYIEDSFPTIAGVGGNGAIIHYHATKTSQILKYLDRNEPVLIDSGGQYEYGTTDVTRTFHFGDPGSELIDAYTRVLKGHIGLDSMKFPENTPGFVLDVVARTALWEVGKDYGHGTGHGVGAALNVHEGPLSISPRWGNKEVLKKSMVVSIEPGYYEDGNFGVRIENLVEIRYVNSQDNVAYQKGLNKGDGECSIKRPGQKTFLEFEKLTMIPIQKNIIDIKLMTEKELNWLDLYHKEVYEKISPMLKKGSLAMNWLKTSCEKIERSDL